MLMPIRNQHGVTMPSGSMGQERKRGPLRPSFLNKFVSLDACPQFFKFKHENAAEEHLDHNPGNFTEAFHGGNIIEKRSGDEFEEDIVHLISENVTDAFDIDELTLSMVAEADPEQTVTALQRISNVNTPSTHHISDGEFTYYDVPADHITLTDPDEFIEQTPESVEPPDTDSLQTAFRDMRVWYTELLFEEVVENIGDADVDDQIPFSLPRHEANSPGKTTQTGYTASSKKGKRAADDPIVVLQPSFYMDIGNWSFAGDADIVFIWPDAHADARIRVVDVKLALEEQTHHQIQTVTYTRAIDTLPALKRNDMVIESGVISQRSSFFPLTPDGIPEFDRESREMDLDRLTRRGGKLDTVFETPYEDTLFQLDSKCTSCEFNEACYTVAIEKAGLELLGIDRGAQQTLRKSGVEDLNDLAKLANTVTDVDPRTDPKPLPNSTHRETYNTIAEKPGIGDQLPGLIQQAQVYLSQLNKDHSHAHNSTDPVHLTNTGNGDIPRDKWIQQYGDNDYQDGSMVRVYLNVQQDHIRDAITAVSYFVTATASTADSISGVVIDENISSEVIKTHHDEHELLETLADELFDAIETVGDAIDFTGYRQNNPFLHFFTFTEDEANTLQDRLTMYVNGEITLESSLIPEVREAPGDTYTVEVNSSSRLTAFRNLIGQRAGADQPMITAVGSDIDSRMALRQPTTGLVNIFRDFYAYWQTEETVSYANWEYKPDDPSRLPDGQTTVDLTDAFGYRMFSNSVQYVQDGDSIKLLHDSTGRSSGKYYGSRVRNAAQMPVPYMWAGTGALTDRWSEEELSEGGIPVNSFRYHNRETKDIEIAVEDIEELLKHMARCLARIEQAIEKRSSIYMKDREDDVEDMGGDLE